MSYRILAHGNKFIIEALVEVSRLPFLSKKRWLPLKTGCELFEWGGRSSLILFDTQEEAQAVIDKWNKDDQSVAQPPGVSSRA